VTINFITIPSLSLIEILIVLLELSYDSLDFVRDYPGELVPEM